MTNSAEWGFWGTVRRMGPVGPVLVVAGTLPPVASFLLLGWVLGWQEQIRGWVTEYGAWSWVVYVVGFMVLAGLPVLPTMVLAVVAGWAFGAGAGSVGAVLGYGLALGLGYTLYARLAGGHMLEVIKAFPRWHAVHEALLGAGTARTVGILFLLRLSPHAPFAPLNVYLAACKVRWGVFMLGSVLGMMPRTILLCVLGANLAKLEFSGGSGWMTWAGIGVTLGVLGVIGWVARRALEKVTSCERLYLKSSVF